MKCLDLGCGIKVATRLWREPADNLEYFVLDFITIYFVCTYILNKDKMES